VGDGHFKHAVSLAYCFKPSRSKIPVEKPLEFPFIWALDLCGMKSVVFAHDF